MKCEQVCELLLAYLDREMRPREELMVEAHLAGCAGCRDQRDAADDTPALFTDAFLP